ncbi:MAG: hypothetical protein AB7P76_05335 [Candidatus Melainabacteria bacterium]
MNTDPSPYKAIAFEFYRYAVCALMLTLFVVATYLLISALLFGGQADDAQVQAQALASGLAVVVFGLTYLIHWFWPSPHTLTKAVGDMTH